MISNKVVYGLLSEKLEWKQFGLIYGKKTVDDITIKIISFIESLGHAPHLGKKVLRLSQYGEIKCVFYKQNHIYYQMFEDTIEIIIV